MHYMSALLKTQFDPTYVDEHFNFVPTQKCNKIAKKFKNKEKEGFKDKPLNESDEE